MVVSLPFEYDYRRLWRMAQRTFGQTRSFHTRIGPAALLFLKIMDQRQEDFFKENNIRRASILDLPEWVVREMKTRGLMPVPPHCRWDYITAHILDEHGKKIFAEALTDFKVLNHFDCPNLQVPLQEGFMDPVETDAFASDLGQTPIPPGMEQVFLPGLFEYFLHRYSQYGGLEESLFIPLPLRRLAFQLTTPGKKRGGIVYDPCCGSGGLLAAFAGQPGPGENRGEKGNIEVYGQCGYIHSRSLCRMNLAVHGVPVATVLEREGGALEKDLYPALRADAVVTAPASRDGAHRWLMHCVDHLKKDGTGAIFFSPGQLKREGEQALLQRVLEDYARAYCLVLLPGGLLEGIEGEVGLLLFGRRERKKGGSKNEKDEEILILDGRNTTDKQAILEKVYTKILERMVDRYSNWLTKSGKYRDEEGFCHRVHVSEMPGCLFNPHP